MTQVYALDVEMALDNGCLWVAMSRGCYWRARRNGKTKTWNRSPERFCTPVRHGFRGYAAITETDLPFVGYEPPAPYVISKTDPSVKGIV